MSLESAQQHLGWPNREQILAPRGAGPRVFAELAREKLGKALRRRPDVREVNVGVLALDSAADATEAPIAVVCEFGAPVTLDTLEETHRLAWNFCRSPLLITVEPHLLRAWSCCEPPAELGSLNPFHAQIEELRFDINGAPSLAQQAANSLHWVELASGEFFRRHPQRFRRELCADGMLLDNLIYVRQRLKELNLPFEVSHDLLARLIFIQFLFQRKDSAGNPALNDRILRRLHLEGRLRAIHRTLADVLRDYDDAYALFRWLNEKFNGDLFPGKGATETEREAEWQAEIAQVRPEHLRLLGQFVSGEIEMRAGQHCLWPQYYFDAIPLEFISSIYEVFVSKGEGSGVHYTPGHLVDFMLDGVLEWNDPHWDVRVLDPACGSGIFLVKSFQRLVYRWRKSHPGEEPSAEILRRILERNLVGVDIDPDAVRVASFSLYLAMCDEIDPRHYWNRVHFPRLRGSQLIHADFFREDVPGIRTKEDALRYDLVVGNAPWGTKSVTDLAREWARAFGWRTAYKDVGPLFLPKAAALTKSTGWITMLQPAGALIFNRVSTALQFRAKFFAEFDVAEVVNLSALRFGLFQKAISPACIITMRPGVPDSAPLTYICPKSLQTHEDEYRVVIEPMDIHPVTRREAAADPLIWTVLAWGGRRDYALIRRMRELPSLQSLIGSKEAEVRQGIIRGDRAREADIVGRPILDAKSFPEGTMFHLDANQLPLNADPQVHSRDSTSFLAFQLPQLIIKQGWRQSHRRFEAALVRHSGAEGILCSKSYISVHMPESRRSTLEAACLTLNSKFAAYFLLLTSGRFASYRPEVNVEDILALPLPRMETPSAAALSYEEADESVRRGLELQDAEWALVEDLFSFTLPDFKGDLSSPGRNRTHRGSYGISGAELEPELASYCDQLLRVLKAGFGHDKRIGTTIFHDGAARLPVRLIALHLDTPDENLRIQQIDSWDLRNRLQLLNERFLTAGDQEGGIFYQRVARIFDAVELGGRTVPTVYYVKPDQIRYWTRTAAVLDADELAAEILAWKHMVEYTGSREGVGA